MHPLLEDETLREEVLDVMWFAVLRVFGWPKSSRHRREPRRMLRGSPYDADDILIQAFKELLDVDPREVREWKALGVTIAQRRAKDALDKSQARLRETERRPRLHLVSGDQPANPSVPAGRTVLESIAHPDDPEAMVIALEEVRRLFALARSLASERDAEIFLRVHCGETRRKVSQDYGITGQRVGQIYDRVLERLEEHEDYPYRDSYGEDE